MIRRPAGRLRIDPLEPKLAEVESIDKDVDDSNRIVLMPARIISSRQRFDPLPDADGARGLGDAIRKKLVELSR
jgi:hypothetical protein